MASPQFGSQHASWKNKVKRKRGTLKKTNHKDEFSLYVKNKNEKQKANKQKKGTLLWHFL